MTVRLQPIGFWSYARQDDEASRGRLSALRSLLKAELQQQYGREQITIFQDVAAIPPGTEWERAIRDAIDRSTFLIPIITPAFIQSEWCSKEWKFFLGREREIWSQFQELTGKRRVFPILYRPIQDIDPYDPADLVELRKLQWIDFRALRHKRDEDEAVQLMLERLAESLCNLLHLRVASAEEVSAGQAEPTSKAAVQADAEAELEAAPVRAAEAEGTGPADRVAAEAPRNVGAFDRTAGAATAELRKRVPGRALLIGGGAAAALLLAAVVVVRPSGPPPAKTVGDRPANAAAAVPVDRTSAPKAASQTNTAAPDPAGPLLGSWSVGGFGCASPLVFTEAGGVVVSAFAGTTAAINPAPSRAAGVLTFRGDDGARYELSGGGAFVIPAGAKHPVSLTRCG